MPDSSSLLCSVTCLAMFLWPTTSTPTTTPMLFLIKYAVPLVGDALDDDACCHEQHGIQSDA